MPYTSYDVNYKPFPLTTVFFVIWPHYNSLLTHTFELGLHAYCHSASVYQSSVLSSGGDSSSGSGESETLTRTCEDIIQRLPKTFSIDAALKRHPPCRTQCLNTVLVQEMCRYNTLLEVITSSLGSVIKAIAGTKSPYIVINSEAPDV